MTPFLQSPAWCVHYYKDNYRQGFFYDCSVVNGGTIPSSNLPKLAPIASCSLDLACLGYFVFHLWFKKKWCIVSKRARIRFIVLCVINSLSAIGMIWSMISHTYPFFTNTCRPIVLLIMQAQSRNHFK